MKRVVFILLALAVGATTTGCGSIRGATHQLREMSAVTFTEAMAADERVTGIKLAACEAIPLPEGFPLKTVGCLMPLRRGDTELTNAEVAALAAQPISGEDVDWIYCPPLGEVTASDCAAVPVFSVVTLYGQRLTGGATWAPNRLSYKEK